MPQINEQVLMDGYFTSCGSGFTFPPSEFFASRDPRALMRVTDQGPPVVTRLPTAEELRDHARANPSVRIWVEGNTLLMRRGRSTQIELARYVGDRAAKKSCVLLNGDGFDDPTLQALQARTRNAASAWISDRKKRLIIPYAALRAARLDFDSVHPIHITQDSNTTQVVAVPKPPLSVLSLSDNIPTQANRARNFVYRGRTYSSQLRLGQRLKPPLHTERVVLSPGYQIMHRPEFGEREFWHQVINPSENVWTVSEQVHRLGASVFSAVGPDGQRHRWVSAFDQNENPAMYFLAQLPDKGGIRYYAHALKALAPPIVHKAREQGKLVRRQGDIFVVETELTDTDMERMGATIVRRDEIFPPSIGETAAHQDLAISDDGRKNWRRRRLLQIYGTSHTATWVAVKPDNATFVKGVMFHDPVLENLRANRRPEHQPVVLPEGMWMLAVRNTVPRQAPINVSSDTTINR